MARAKHSNRAVGLSLVAALLMHAPGAWAWAGSNDADPQPSAVADVTQRPLRPAPPALAPTPSERRPDSISLAPAVLELRGKPGEGTRQTLRLTNHTSIPLTFVMEAQDILVNDGRRVFVPAGETPHSIAATAVFSQKEMVVQPGSTAAVDVTLTVPGETTIRAVAAIFRGRTQTRHANLTTTASLATLITFNLSERVSVAASLIEVGDQADTANLSISQWLTNTGTEPVIPSGLLVVANQAGALVGKVAVEAQRLLPGERLQFKAEFPSALKPGDYRAILAFQYAGKTVTHAAAFQVE